MGWSSITYTFSPSTVAKSSEVNQNFSDCVANIDKAAPTGAEYGWYTNTAPAGFLLLDGSAVSRTTYARLFALLGTTYGSGDGSTTFNLPNKKGRVGVGRDSAQSEFNDLGETGGAKTHTLTVDEMPAHKHALGYSFANGTVVSEVRSGDTSGASPDSSMMDNTGGGQAHNNLQPYIVQNYIIKD